MEETKTKTIELKKFEFDKLTNKVYKTIVCGNKGRTLTIQNIIKHTFQNCKDNHGLVFTRNPNKYRGLLPNADLFCEFDEEVFSRFLDERRYNNNSDNISFVIMDHIAIPRTSKDLRVMCTNNKIFWTHIIISSCIPNNIPFTSLEDMHFDFDYIFCLKQKKPHIYKEII